MGCCAATSCLLGHGGHSARSPHRRRPRRQRISRRRDRRPSKSLTVGNARSHTNCNPTVAVAMRAHWLTANSLPATDTFISPEDFSPERSRFSLRGPRSSSRWTGARGRSRLRRLFQARCQHARSRGTRVWGRHLTERTVLRDLLYQGFNADEEGRRALDGVLAHVAGAGRAEFNSNLRNHRAMRSPRRQSSSLPTSFRSPTSPKQIP